MRKIEEQMNEAIRFCRNWTSGNTQVVTETDHSVVYLHGNLIAKVYRDAIQLFDGGWQSNTTKSRLNAILDEFGNPNERVFQSNFEWYLQMYDRTSIPFFSGMRLN